MTLRGFKNKIKADEVLDVMRSHASTLTKLDKSLKDIKSQINMACAEIVRIGYALNWSVSQPIRGLLETNQSETVNRCTERSEELELYCSMFR